MPKKKTKKKKSNGSVGGKADVHAHEEGKRNKSLLGHNAIFTPEVIDDIHIKSQLGRYRMRGMALMKKIPTFDDLVFLPGTLTRFVIAGMTTREMVNVLRGLSGLNLVSADVVEVSPAYDHAEVTSLAAATIVYELTNLFAKS